MLYKCNICGESYYDPKECFDCVNKCFNNYCVGKFVYNVSFGVDRDISRTGFRPKIALDTFDIITRLPIDARTSNCIYHKSWLLYDQVAEFKECSRALFDELIKEQLLNSVEHSDFEDRCVIIDDLIKQFDRAHASFWEDLLSLTNVHLLDCMEERHLVAR